MEASITPFRIANAILQDKDFSGYYVLVEGKKDIKIYRRFIIEEAAKIKATFGKYKQREVLGILDERSFSKVLGIRDADYLRINGNLKYDPDYAGAVFATDCHDSELMMIQADVLSNYLVLISEDEKVLAFEDKVRKKLPDLLLDLLYSLGCLRLANKRFSLGLSFKPEKPDGNKLKINKFISENSWTYLGDEIMINTVVEYSKNRGTVVSCREVIKEKLKEIADENHPAIELVNGHDISQLLLLVSKNGLDSKNKLLQNADCVEDLLIASFDLLKFSGTKLFKNLLNWQVTRQTEILRAI
ncbi:MAG: DUF4435 domain-containing protein [Dechloromonas sp.]|uniref:DUF4435 domain-containing protein n=1 Tax=Candidatus Dechloromonas phosphorivorans TaxID=2899244 RepID=A0A935MZZ1_9RHOO|nr:DUF4435 domain-containing protein [Candidatus Dechloromonas phosphorivorans]